VRFFFSLFQGGGLTLLKPFSPKRRSKTPHNLAHLKKNKNKKKWEKNVEKELAAKAAAGKKRFRSFFFRTSHLSNSNRSFI